jgi:hypothetical protein
MRRSTRLRLAVAAVVIAIFGAYTAFWFVVAARVEDGFAQWAASLHQQNLDLSWRGIQAGGFPLSFRVVLSDLRLRDLEGATPTREVRVPLLSGSASPWSLRSWQLSAPQGLSGTANLAGDTVATLTVPRASGSVAIADDGSSTLWFGLDEPGAEAGERFTARDLNLWLAFPAHRPQTHTERAFGVAVDLHGLSLPTAPAPFRNPVDEIAGGVTMMGSIAGGAAREAATAWRDSGGTLELDHLMLRWEMLRITCSGTMALDADLQPMGAFSGAVEGYDVLLKAFVAAGRMRAGDATLAQLALGVLARAGPDGRPEIATSFTIQNGQMFFGPVKLGKAPQIVWK